MSVSNNPTLGKIAHAGYAAAQNTGHVIISGLSIASDRVTSTAAGALYNFGNILTGGQAREDSKKVEELTKQVKSTGRRMFVLGLATGIALTTLALSIIAPSQPQCPHYISNYNCNS